MTTKKKSKIMTWDELKAQTEVDVDLRINLFKEIEKDGTLAVSEKYNVARKRVSCWYGGNKNKIQAEIDKRSEENEVYIPAAENDGQSSDDVDTLSDWDKLLLRINEEKGRDEYNTLFGLMDEVDDSGMSATAEKYNTTENVVREFLLAHEHPNTTNEEPQLESSDEPLSWDDALMNAALDAEAYLNLVDFISCSDDISAVAKKYDVSENVIKLWFSFNNGTIDSNSLLERVSATYAEGGIHGDIGCMDNLLNDWNMSCLKLYDALNAMQCNIDIDKSFANLVCAVSSMDSLPILDDGVFESSNRDDKYDFKYAISEIAKDVTNANRGIQDVRDKVYPNLTKTTYDLRRENDVIEFIVDTVPRDMPYKQLAFNANILYGLAYLIEYVNRGVINIDKNEIHHLIDCSSDSEYVKPILMASALGKMINCVNLRGKESIVGMFDYTWFHCCRITALPFISTIIAYNMTILRTRVAVLWAAVKTINSGDIEIYSNQYVETLIGFSHFTINSLTKSTNLPKYTCNEIINDGVNDFRELLSHGCVDYDDTMFSFNYDCSVIYDTHDCIDYVSMIMLSQYCRYVTVVYSDSRNICSTGVFKRGCVYSNSTVPNDIGVAVHIVWITLLKTLCTFYLRMTPFGINEKSAAWDILNLDRMIFNTNIHDVCGFGYDKDYVKSKELSFISTIPFNVGRIKLVVKLVSKVKNLNIAMMLMGMNEFGDMSYNVRMFIDNVYRERTNQTAALMLTLLMIKTNVVGRPAYTTPFNTVVNFSPCKIKFIRKLSKLPYHIAEKWIINLCSIVYSDLPVTTNTRTRIDLILEIINKLGHKEMMHPNKSADKVLEIIEKMN